MAKYGNAAPAQEEMSSIENAFGSKDALLVKQTMRGCIQECLGCEAKSEYKISSMDWSNLADGYKANEAAMNAPDEFYALEKSSFCMRCCWRDGRGFEMNVSEGGEAGGKGLLKFNKPCGMPLNFTIPVKDQNITIPCCCLLPKVDTLSAGGAPLGSESKYLCDINLFVPKLQYSEDGAAVYVVKPETCMGGCCIACDPCTGKGCIFLPFYFHDPATMTPIGGYDGEAPQIKKVWAGLKKECCSTADTFAVKFPPGIDAKRKAGLLGMTFLIDFTVFERQQEK